MLPRRIEIGIGLTTVALALLLLFVVIPFGIVTPKSVNSIFLSPTFWPYILGLCLTMVGAALALQAWLTPEENVGREDLEQFDRPAILRLAGFFAIIVLYYLLIPALGMVWSSSLAFAGVVLVTNARSKVLGIICAVALPVLLFAFFYHVAAVPIPQGTFLRLP